MSMATAATTPINKLPLNPPSSGDTLLLMLLMLVIMPIVIVVSSAPSVVSLTSRIVTPNSYNRRDIDRITQKSKHRYKLLITRTKVLKPATVIIISSIMYHPDIYNQLIQNQCKPFATAFDMCAVIKPHLSVIYLYRRLNTVQYIVYIQYIQYLVFYLSCLSTFSP